MHSLSLPQLSKRKLMGAGTIAATLMLSLSVTAVADKPVPELCLKSTFGGFGTGPGEFNEPRSLEITATRIYVADKNNHRVQIFDRDMVLISQFGSFDTDGTGQGYFDEPGNIAIDHEGNVFVAEHGHDTRRIQKFTTDGEFIAQWGKGAGNREKGKKIGEFNKPRGIAVDEQGRVYVAERANNRIQVFDGDGNFLDMVGLSAPEGGSGEGEFNEAMDVDVSHNGSVYVVDRKNNRIQRFSKYQKGLNFELEWGAKGSGEGEFNRPRGIGLSNSGDVYVADMVNLRVQIFDKDGNYHSEFGNNAGWDQLHFISIDQHGSAYVTDDHNLRVFSSDACE